MAEKTRGAKSAETEGARADAAATDAQLADIRAAVVALTATVEELRHRLDAIERRFRHY